jgi:dipeptidase D
VPGRRFDETLAAIRAFDQVARAELASVEPALSIAAEPVKARGARVWKRALEQRVLMVLSALPHGVIKMSADIPGLVETSTNVASIATRTKQIVVATSQRSSVASEIEEIADTVRAVFELGGATVTGSDGYPGWKPDLESRVLKHAVATYRKLYGRDPEVKAIHAGLECGIIGEKVPGMDMVSFGPTLEGVHSPDEKIHIASVKNYWDFLVALLADWR